MFAVGIFSEMRRFSGSHIFMFHYFGLNIMPFLSQAQDYICKPCHAIVLYSEPRCYALILTEVRKDNLFLCHQKGRSSFGVLSNALEELSSTGGSTSTFASDVFSYKLST